ncbi:MAG: polyphosphate polymerase domain-containing protein [Lachnospiraceae bacterium]|nr:polyphosphate polymerase domain-containing protein [Lachnospiraceae bacterium]
MAIEVFSRYEKKYLLTEENYHWILENISEHMVPDKFNKNGQLYNIANIYYDTSNDALIRASIEKPVYKEKLRLRSYGVPALEDKVFLEIKKKYKGLVNKRRTTLRLFEAYDLIEHGIDPGDQPYINRQVLEEIKYFLRVYDLKPKVYLTYDRQAFFSKDDRDFRITFDTNIKARREEVGLEKGNEGRLLINNAFWLMEVKSSEAVPLWFTSLLSEKQIFSTSFSKYGTEYKQMIQNRDVCNMEGELLCPRQYLKQQLHYQPLTHSLA